MYRIEKFYKGILKYILQAILQVIKLNFVQRMKDWEHENISLHNKRKAFFSGNSKGKFLIFWKVNYIEFWNFYDFKKHLLSVETQIEPEYVSNKS